MATKNIVVDDLDGTEDATTISFSLEGQAYEIDLSPKNLTKLRGALDPFIPSARKVGGKKASFGTRVKATDYSSHERASIRQWAKDNGYTVSDRGVIKAEIVEAYAAAH